MQEGKTHLLIKEFRRTMRQNTSHQRASTGGNSTDDPLREVIKTTIMRIKKYRSLGLNIPVSVFESREEYNAAAKRPNEDAVVEDANDNLTYRGPLADFREEFCLAVEDATSVKRETKPSLDKKGVQRVDSETKEPIFEYTENEADYFRRVVATTGRSIESFQDIADSVAASHENVDENDNVISVGLVVDPTVRERKPTGPKTPAKATYAIADELIASGKAKHTAADLSKLLGRTVEIQGHGTEESKKADRETLARAIHEYQLAEIRRIKSQFALPKVVAPTAS